MTFQIYFLFQGMCDMFPFNHIDDSLSSQVLLLIDFVTFLRLLDLRQMISSFRC